jgi:hypothetical protein
MWTKRTSQYESPCLTQSSSRCETAANPGPTNHSEQYSFEFHSLALALALAVGCFYFGNGYRFSIRGIERGYPIFSCHPTGRRLKLRTPPHKSLLAVRYSLFQPRQGTTTMRPVVMQSCPPPPTENRHLVWIPEEQGTNPLYSTFVLPIKYRIVPVVSTCRFLCMMHEKTLLFDAISESTLLMEQEVRNFSTTCMTQIHVGTSEIHLSLLRQGQPIRFYTVGELRTTSTMELMETT